MKMLNIASFAAVATLAGIGFTSPSMAATTLDGSTVNFQYYAYGGTYNAEGSP